MPRRKKQTGAESYLTERVDEFSGLLTEHPTTLSKYDLAKAENVQYTLQGKIEPRPGQRKRFATDFDSNPVKGIGGYYKSDGTTRLVFASGTTLYVDNPHVSFVYDSQTDWQQSKAYTNLDTSSSPGDVKMVEILSDGFEDGNFNKWTSFDSGWTIDAFVYKSGSYSAKGIGAQQKLVYDFKQNRVSVYVKLACRFAETNQAHYPVIFISPTGSQIQAVVAGSDGHFKYHNGSALTNFPVDTTYSANTWYIVEVWFSNGTFWVSINGTSVTTSGLSAKDTSNVVQTQVAKFQAQNAGTTSATMWIDDVVINPIAAVFSRSSAAYTSTGAKVNANIPRFESAQASIIRTDYFLYSDVVVTNPNLSIYQQAGLPNPPVGGVFLGASQSGLPVGDLDTPAACWAIICLLKIYRQTGNINAYNRAKLVGEFIKNNLVINASFFGYPMTLIANRMVYNGTSWVKSLETVHVRTQYHALWALLELYEATNDSSYISLIQEIMRTCGLVYNNIKSRAGTEIASWMKGAVYNHFALISGNNYSMSWNLFGVNQTSDVMYYAITKYINIFGNNQIADVQGTSFYPQSILDDYKAWVVDCYNNHGLLMSNGCMYNFYHYNWDDPQQGGLYIPTAKNWDWFNNVYGDVWWTSDLQVWGIIGIALLGETTIARAIRDAFIRLRASNTTDVLFYDLYKVDGTPHDYSLSICVTGLLYRLDTILGISDLLDSYLLTLGKYQIASTNSLINGGYPWDVSVTGCNLETKATGEIVYIADYRNFGNALLIEEATTNIIPAADHDFQGSPWSSYGGATVTITANQSDPFGGKNAYRIQTSGGTNILKYYGSWGTSASGTSYAHSVWVKCLTGTVQVRANVGGQYRNITPSDGWVRVQLLGTGDGSTQIQIQFRALNTTDSLDFIAYRPQIETKAYVTSWTDSTRSAESLLIPTAGVLNPSEGTIEFKVKPLIVTNWNNFFNMATSNGRFLLFFGADGSATFDYGPNNSGPSAPAGSIAPNSWYYIALRWSATTGKQALFINGIKYEKDLPNGVASSFPLVVSVVNNYSAYITSLRISFRARTDEEIVAVAQSQLPLAWDVDTTYLLLFENNIDLPADRQGVWISPVQNASNASDYSTLAVVWEETLQPNTSIICQVRTSNDGVSWSPWYTQVNGQPSSAPARPYSQVRFILQEIDNASSPVLSKATVIYEGNPSATAVKTNFSAADKYFFSQLMDKLIVCNGVDFPVAYDGSTITDLTAAPRVALITVFRNRLFGAKTGSNKSRLYFSDLLDVTSWPSTNFIDVNPSDGDEIMCLIANASAFLILKQHQSYYLSGYSPYDFTISPAGEGGTISPWGAVWTPRGIFMLDREGIWLTDFRKRVLITKPIQAIWDSLNQSALTKAALFYYKDKLLAAVPSKNASANDTLLVYDMTQPKANRWSVWTGWNPGCFTAFWEKGSWKYLYGSSLTGNVYEIGGSSDDAGTPFTAVVETGQIPYVSEDFIKRLKWCDVYFGNGQVDTTVQVSFIVDGVASAPVTFTVPANRILTVKRLFPPPWGKTVGLRIVWPSTGAGGPTFLGYTMTYYPRAPRPERVW